MNIMMISDNNYLSFAETLIKSISCHHRNFKIFLVHSEEIDINYIEHINFYLKDINSSLVSAKISDEIVEKFGENITGYITNATFLRYYIELLYPYTTDPHWLYIDIDTVVTGNIEDVFEIPEFKLFPLSACFDPHVMGLENYDFLISEHFNAGVMYINANLWKNKTNLLNRLTKLLLDKIKHVDQDILNIVFHGQWNKLHRIYNYQNNYMYSRMYLTNNEPEHEELKLKPRVLHFTGPLKPWHLDEKGNYLHPYSFVFNYYRNLNWEDIVTNPIGTFNIIF